MIKYDEYGVKIKQNEGVWQSDESSESLRQLWRDRDDRLAAAELHWRVALPLSALVLTLLGAPLSRISPRSGRYGRIIPGIILYIIYVNFLFLAKAWLKKGVLTPELGMWWVHGIMLFIAVFLICGQVGWRNLGVRRK